ncbi:hypothetical protein [Microbacterium sp. NPDC076911]|uniref:hypothetical protein n=1 Tax=Microbacterium sp. NPDC076911 TaxID=3154958 RepID=UPI0034477AAD
MATEVEKLRAELEELRQENAALKTASPEPAATVRSTPAKSRAGWWRAALSAFCIILAGFMVPVSVVASWARVELVSEDAFVATFAPLADDPGVQALIIDEAVTAIDASIDVETYTDSLFDGIATLDLPPAALTALNLLRAPAASGVQSLIETGVTKAVESDAFASVWRTALVASHRALIATATADDTDGIVTIANDGTLAIQLGPIVEELKSQMVEQGIGVASLIPAISTSIDIVQSDALVLVGTIYAIAVAVGWWLPVVCLALFAIGIALARRRSVAVLGTGIAIAIGSGLLAAGFAGANAVLGINASALGIPTDTLSTIFYAVVGAMQDTAVVLAFLGVVIAVSGWLAGRSRHAARARAFSGTLSTAARGSLQRNGLNTGRFGEWMFQQRLLVRAIILVLAVLLVFALRPLSIGDILLVVVLALVAWLAATLVQRTPDDVAASPQSDLDDPGGAGDTLVLDDAVAPDADLVAATPSNAETQKLS